MAGITAIQGVDDTLRNLSKVAVSGLNPTVAITVGPLDREDDRTRINWFLYQITPNAAISNMEHPREGWVTSRGRPPLSLQLHYLLSGHAAPLTQNGDEEQFAHRAVGAVMQALHDNAIVGESNPQLSNLAKPLVEPLRITMDPLDLEGLSKLWTAASESIRLSVGYLVSLVIIETEGLHTAGPPVRERRLQVAPTMGPHLVSVPERISAGIDFTVVVQGLTAGAQFLLTRSSDDPAGPTAGWPVTVVGPAPDSVPNGMVVRFAQADLPPGSRGLEVSATQDGLLIGKSTAAVSLVPRVTGPAGGAGRGTTVNLSCTHAAPDVEVFLGGSRVAAAGVSFVSPTQVQLTIPQTTPLGSTEVQLRAAKVAGPSFTAMVVTP